MGFVDWMIGLGPPTAGLGRAIRLSEKGKGVEASPLLARAAKAGIVDAEYRIAQSYLEGRGVPPSRAEGARWLQRAATHGSLEAQLMLSALCINGLIKFSSDDASDVGIRADSLFADDVPTDPNFEAALRWSRQADQTGSAQGQALLAYVLTNGPESMRDLEEAHQWYERSAAADCPEGCLGYAMSLARQSTDEENLVRVVGLLRRAAEAGIPTAIYLLGVLAEQGAGMTRDPMVAVQFFRHAAERGHRSAQVRWGLALIEGQHVEKDPQPGQSSFRRAPLARAPAPAPPS